MDHPPPPPANAEAAADAGVKESSVNVVRETARSVEPTSTGARLLLVSQLMRIRICCHKTFDSYCSF